MSDLTLALHALDALTQQIAPAMLDRTAYCALVLRLVNGGHVVLLSEAGGAAAGISAPLLQIVETTIRVATISCSGASADAEQRALDEWTQAQRNVGNLQGSVVRALATTREICASCTHTLTTLGLQVNGNTAERV